MDAAAENPLVRRHLLEILQAARDRQRGPQDDISTYVAEALLQRLLALRGFPLPIERVRGELFWLRDREYVRFKETRAGRERYVFWRITAKGSDVVEGTDTDRGVADV